MLSKFSIHFKQGNLDFVVRNKKEIEGNKLFDAHFLKKESKIWRKEVKAKCKEIYI